MSINLKNTIANTTPVSPVADVAPVTEDNVPGVGFCIDCESELEDCCTDPNCHRMLCVHCN